MTESTRHAFQAEVAEVLRLVVTSLYSHKEVFLRELVSNGADALDKLRFQAISNPELMATGEALKVQILVELGDQDRDHFGQRRGHVGGRIGR